MNILLHYVSSIFKRIHLNLFLYKILVPFSHQKLVIDEQTIESARLFLEQVSPNHNKSSFCHNVIKKTPVFDLTIIVPAYNVELYIQECLDSILAQKTTYTFQVIIVNDGSTDRTGTLLEQYRHDKRVKIINQANKGLSGARNAALKEIDSRYIAFVDSDDYLCENAIEILLGLAYKNNSDIVEGSYQLVRDGKVISVCCHKNETNTNSRNYATENLFGFSWGKVFKSTLYENIQFPENYWFEDTINTFLVFSKAKKVLTISDLVYSYRMNPAGISNSSRRKNKSIDSFWIMERMLADMELMEISKSQLTYQQILQHIKLTDRRISLLSSEIDKAIFILTVDLLQNEFAGFKTSEKKWRSYEIALRNHDYGVYKLYGECFI